MTDLIAILDIGKTNAKVVLADPQSGAEVFCAKRTNATIDSPLGRQLDVAGIEHWLFDSLRSAPRIEDVVAIVPIAHGAAAVLMDADDQVVAAPDYEDTRFNDVSAGYGPLRDAFQSTFSPSLPVGLNLARQLFYVQQRHAPIFASVRNILLFPQYWSWRLSGVMASEVTSLGCHTDLWRPLEGALSQLARAQDWDRLLPPLRNASDSLATITPEVAARTGLRADCRVTCGIHDSNASYLQYLLRHGRERPFAAVSSGTWTIVMANRGNLSQLQEQRDMLANVDAFGSPVATARFMGGREYEAIARTATLPTMESLQSILARRVFALPSFAEAGPFPRSRGEIINGTDLSDAERAALATLYVSLMTDLTLDALDARGDVYVDGPLASNPLFARILATLRPGASICATGTSSGVCVRAATWLAGLPLPQETSPAPAAAITMPDVVRYRDEWRTRCTRLNTSAG